MAKVDPFEYAKEMVKKAKKVTKPPIVMPYPGEKYEYLDIGGTIYVEGWKDTLVINRIVVYNHLDHLETYKIKDPIILPDTRFYGEYCSVRDYNIADIWTNAKIMFHGVYNRKRKYNIQRTCFGNMQTCGKWTLKELKSKCTEAASSLSVICIPTLHNDDILCPANSKHKPFCDYMSKQERNMGCDVPNFDKYFEPLL